MVHKGYDGLFRSGSYLEAATPWALSKTQKKSGPYGNLLPVPVNCCLRARATKGQVPFRVNSRTFALFRHMDRPGKTQMHFHKGVCFWWTALRMLWPSQKLVKSDLTTWLDLKYYIKIPAAGEDTRNFIILFIFLFSLIFEWNLKQNKTTFFPFFLNE